MIGGGKNNLQKAGWLVLKAFIVLAALYYLWQKLSHTTDLASIAHYFAELAGRWQTWLLALLALLLSVPNWLLESTKWQRLIAKLEPISSANALRAVLAGLTISTFTPNRIGDYAGRVAYMRESSKGQATVVTVLGNLAQLLVTLVAGAFGAVGTMYLYTIPTWMGHPMALALMLLVTTICCGVAVGLFLRIPRSPNLLNKLKLLRKFERYHRALSWYTRTDLAVTVLFSLARYAVFCAQFLVLLALFQVDVDWWQSLLLISATYLIVTAIPTIALTEIGVREAVAVQLFSLASADALGVVAATFSLWVINLALPTLAGAFFVMSYRPALKPSADAEPATR